MDSSNSSSAPDFAALVTDHYEGLFRFALSLTRQEADAADLVQQTFYIWATKGASLRDQTKVKSWLFTSLYREFLRLRRRATPFVSAEPEMLEYEAEPVAPDVVEAVDASDAVEALQELDEAFRAPLTLFYLENMTYKEIADSLDVPIGTVMSRLSRGKTQLKAALRRRQQSATAARMSVRTDTMGEDHHG